MNSDDEIDNVNQGSDIEKGGDNSEKLDNFINQLTPLFIYASPGVRKSYFQNLSSVK
jgi:hypothetical protein